MAEKTRLEGIRERDAAMNEPLYAPAVKDRRWLLERVDCVIRFLDWQAAGDNPLHDDRCKWFNHRVPGPHGTDVGCVHIPWWDCPSCNCGLRDLMSALHAKETD